MPGNSNALAEEAKYCVSKFGPLASLHKLVFELYSVTGPKYENRINAMVYYFEYGKTQRDTLAVLDTAMAGLKVLH